jgi:hypothetical protein
LEASKLESSEFSIESFQKRKRDFRADKGKRHKYPVERRSPCLNSSLNVQETNLSLNAKHGKVFVMKHKGTASMREYWRSQKAVQRSREKAKKETESTDKVVNFLNDTVCKGKDPFLD